MAEAKRFFTMAEVAEELNVCEDTIKQWRRKGNTYQVNFIKYVTFMGGKPIISVENLKNYLNDLPAMNEVVGQEI